MQHRFRASVWLAAGALLLSAACQPCERGGCAAVDTRSQGSISLSRGLVGAIAVQSDVVVDGCQECGFGTAQLTIWETSERIGSSQAADRIVQTVASLRRIDADGRYEVSLDPGHFLICLLPERCAAITVPEAGVVNLNVMRRAKGESTFVIFEPGAAQRRTDGIFALGLN
jgi:hypothetical protein